MRILMISCVGPATKKLQYRGSKADEHPKNNEQTSDFGGCSSHASTGTFARQD
jgi:hypothetical protein